MKKIVLTGGPSGGKTTALSILKETFGNKIALVQEAATLIYSGGFPRKDNSPVHIEHAQNIIFYTVHQLEELAEKTSNAKIMVCDRGSIDGAVYWPKGPEDFYQATNVRTENLQQAFDLDDRILKIWEKHPNRLVIPREKHYFEKAEIIKNFVEKLISE